MITVENIGLYVGEILTVKTKYKHNYETIQILSINMETQKLRFCGMYKGQYNEVDSDFSVIEDFNTIYDAPQITFDSYCLGEKE